MTRTRIKKRTWDGDGFLVSSVKKEEKMPCSLSSFEPVSRLISNVTLKSISHQGVIESTSDVRLG